MWIPKDAAPRFSVTEIKSTREKNKWEGRHGDKKMGEHGGQKVLKTLMRTTDGEEVDIMCCQHSTEHELTPSWKASSLAHHCWSCGNVFTLVHEFLSFLYNHCTTPLIEQDVTEHLMITLTTVKKYNHMTSLNTSWSVGGVLVLVLQMLQQWLLFRGHVWGL